MQNHASIIHVQNPKAVWLSLTCDLESEFRVIRMPWHTAIKMKTDRHVMLLDERDKTLFLV